MRLENYNEQEWLQLEADYLDKEEIMSEKEVMYADIVDGNYDMTLQDIIQIVKDNPDSSNPDDDFFFGTDGTVYSVNNIKNMI